MSTWQQFGNNYLVGRNNHCNLYKNKPHIRIKLKQNKLRWKGEMRCDEQNFYDSR